MAAAPTIAIGESRAGDRVELAVEDVLTSRSVLFGQSGSGKSNSASVVIERLLEGGHAVLIVDTDGEYYGLKERYEVLHAAGDEEGDIQVGPEHAEHLASLALEQNVPVILDVSAFLDPEDADELVGKVARQLFAKAKKLKKPFLLVVEEAHEYVPQSGGGGFAADHITRIAKRGRKHGLGFLGISQRPANVDKDVVTQANMLVWHRLKFDSDTGRVKELYGADVADDVVELEDGEAYVDSEFIGGRDWIRWDRKETYDAGATPGLEDTDKPELRSIDEEVLEELRAAGGAAKSREELIDELEEDLSEREERIAELEAEVDRLEERNAWEEQMAERAFEGLGGDLEIDLGGEGSIRADVLEIVEERDELDKEVEDLEAELADARGEVDRLEAEVDRLETELAEVEQDEELRQLRDDLRELLTERYDDVLQVESDDRVDQLRQRLEDKEGRVDELERELERVKTGRAPPSTEPEGFDDLVDKLRTDAIREAVSRAMDHKTDNTGEDVVWKVLIALARVPDPPVHASEILGSVPVRAKETVSRILSALEEVDLATSERGSHNRKLYRINEAGIDTWIQRYARDEEVDAIASEISRG